MTEMRRHQVAMFFCAAPVGTAPTAGIQGYLLKEYSGVTDRSNRKSASFSEAPARQLHRWNRSTAYGYIKIADY
ncbi:MAG: hypothetical protein ACYTHJ_22360 [Planctomycetota bacterium]|jgi:hypothetical protein